VQNKNAIKLTLLLSSMMTILANAIIAPALPEINRAFASVNNAELLSKLLMTLPALTIAIFASFIGNFIDKIGRLKILFASLLLFAVAGTSGLWLETLPQILVGRFFLGFGVAGIMTVTTTLIGDYFKDAERQQLIGFQGAFMGFGGMIFITLAGYLTDINWRFPFGIYAFSLLVLILAYNYLYEPKSESAITNNTTLSSIQIDKKTIYTIYFSAFIGIVMFYILPLQIPFYIKTLGYKSSSMSGWAISALTTSQAISSFFYRKIRMNFSNISIYGFSFSLMAIGFFIISSSFDYWQIIIGLLVSGVGTAWLMPNSSLWLLAVTPENLRGKFIGRLTTFIFLGQFMSPVLVQPIQNLVGAKNTFLVLSIVLVVMAISYYAMNKKSNKTANE
jgi:MFS family permease